MRLSSNRTALVRLEDEMNAITKPTAFEVGNFNNGTTRDDLQRQWIARPIDEKFLSLASLSKFVARRAEAAKETRLDARKIEFFAPDPKTRADLERLSLGFAGGEEVAPTNWSFGQLASLAQAPSGYLRKLPSTLVADCLNYGLKYSRAVDELKLYATGDELLAATGPDYGRIWDHEVVDAVRSFAGDGTTTDRWRAPGLLDWQTNFYDPQAEITVDTTSYFASDRDVWIMLVDSSNPIEVGKLPNGEPDLLTRGIIITNSEVGKSALKIMHFYFRACCQNRLLWGCERFEEISMRHSKGAPDRFMTEASPALRSFANGSATKLIEAVANAKAAKVAESNEQAIEFLVGRSLSRAKALAILEQGEKEEGAPPRSAWDMAQAITANARSIEYTDERIEQERIAKGILDKVS
jgi:hypothetical protein